VCISRCAHTHQNNASDCVNVSLNYAYSLVESEVRRGVNSIGIEPSLGFLHDVADYQTKESLVYDLQEPFRFLADLCVIEAFERRILDKKDFYFTFADLRYRFSEEPKLRFVNLIRERFNSGVQYKGRRLRWDTVILEKTNELARYLTGKVATLSFAEPKPTLGRSDSRELRSRILALTSAEAKQLAIPKQSLHDIRKKARSEKPFKLYRETAQKLEIRL